MAIEIYGRISGKNREGITEITLEVPIKIHWTIDKHPDLQKTIFEVQKIELDHEELKNFYSETQLLHIVKEIEE